MTCEQSRRLISLYRAGERTDAENRSLEEHLRSCPSCAKENEEVQALVSSAKSFASRDPVLDGPAEFTREIMVRVDRVRARRKRTFLESFLLPAEQPAVRMVLVSVVIAAVGLFGIQGYQTMMDMHSIEQRFSHSLSVTKGAHINYEVDLSGTRISQDQRNTLRRAGFLEGDDQHVIVTAEMLRIAWSIVERPFFAGTSKELNRMELDWTRLSQELISSTRVQLALIPNR